MPDNPFGKKSDGTSNRLKSIGGALLHRLGVWWREDSVSLREKAKLIFDSTSDQVLVKAEETRRAVKLRMAIMEVEHNLNRLYAQIGKLSCDAAPDKSDSIPIRGDLEDKLILAREYRERLEMLREEQTQRGSHAKRAEKS